MAKVLIFGYGGIGGSLAKMLTSKGTPVHLVGRNQNALKDLSQQLKCSFSVCDVTKESDIEKAVSEAVSLTRIAF